VVDSKPRPFGMTIDCFRSGDPQRGAAGGHRGGGCGGGQRGGASRHRRRAVHFVHVALAAPLPGPPFIACATISPSAPSTNP
jgi:hypothetical protein